MAKRDHEPITFDRYMGLFARIDERIPGGYLVRCEHMVFMSPDVGGGSNNDYGKGAIATREPLSNVIALAAAAKRFYLYTKASGTRYIYLDASGNFRDQTAGTIILTLASAVDFHGITINDRFYFTPIASTNKGLASEAVYVYDPSLGATARKAAGAPATGTFTVAVSATAGNIEPGLHVVSISFETNTGFVTKPALHQTFTAPAARKRLDLTAIPTGPSGTVARWIWLSKRVVNYDGNPVPIETFFAYKINDNTTTVLNNTVDAYDSQLITSSDQYDNLLSEIPAGTFLSEHDGRLVSCGSDANPDTVHVSLRNEPESVDSVDGLRVISKGFGGTVNTTRDFKGTIYCFKDYVTLSLNDNGDVPKNWDVKIIDTALGAPRFGVGEVLAQLNVSTDYLLVGNSVGLFVFTGSYGPNLLHNVENAYSTVFDITRVNTDIKVAIDPHNKRIYFMYPGASSLNGLMMIDYAYGLLPNTVRVSDWPMEFSLVSKVTDLHVILSASIARPVLVLTTAGNANIKRLVPGTFSSTTDAGLNYFPIINWQIKHPELFNMHIESVVFEGTGATTAGGFRVAITAKNDGSTGRDKTLTSNFEKYLVKYNHTSYLFTLEMSNINNGTVYFSIGPPIAYIKEMWQEAPE